MSRVGSSAITIPADVTLSQQDGMVVVKGKNGELSAPLHSEVELSVADWVYPQARNQRCWLSCGYAGQ
jgi:large subunit ribosomal protein L6